MSKKSEKKVALITGGASGLGLSIAKKFVSEGIFVIIVGRDTDKLNKAEKELKGNCASYAFDLTNLSEIPVLVQEIQKKHHSIDILVNNAGIHLKKPLLEVSDTDFQRVILTNLTVVFSLSREVSKVMIHQKSGSIINISSMAAIYGIPKVIAYTAAKSGVEGMTRAMAVELSSKGIRINCIAPGFIRTNMSSGALDNDPERKERVLSRTPMGKLGQPKDVASAAYYLATDASEFITGVILPVDGGNAIGF